MIVMDVVRDARVVVTAWYDGGELKEGEVLV